MIDLDFVNIIYNEALKSHMVGKLLLISQLLAGFWIMYTLLMKWITSKNPDEKSLKAGDIMRPIMLFALVFTYPYLLTGLDVLASGLEDLLKSWAPDGDSYISTDDFQKYLNNGREPTENMNAFQKMNYHISRIYNYFTHPAIAITENFRLLFYGIDQLIYGIVLIERAIKMFMLRIVGSFAIIASMYHRFEGFAANWGKMYLINYLWVVFLFIINFFAEFVFHVGREVKLSGKSDNDFDLIVTLLYLTILFVKVKLYKKSFQFLKETLSNN